MTVPYSFTSYLKDAREYWSSKGMLGYVVGNTLNDLGTIGAASVASTLGSMATLTGTERGKRIGQRMQATTEAIRDARSDAYQNAGGAVKAAYDLGEFVAPAAVGAGAANLGVKALNFGARAVSTARAGRTAQLLASTAAGAGTEAVLQGGQNAMEGGSVGDTLAMDAALNAVGAYGAGRYMLRNFRYSFNPRAIFSENPRFVRSTLDGDYANGIFQRENLRYRNIPETRRFAIVEPIEQEISDYLKEKRDETSYDNALAYSDY